GADRDRLDLVLGNDHVFQGRAECDGKPTVGNENQAYHVKIGTPAGAYSRPTARKGAIMTMCGASARGSRKRRYIFRSAIGKAKKSELSARFCGAQRSKHERNRVRAGRDAKSREGHAGEF